MTRLTINILIFLILTSCGQQDDKSPNRHYTESTDSLTIAAIPFSTDSVSIDMGVVRATLFNFALYDSIKYSGDSIILTDDPSFPIENVRMKLYPSINKDSIVVQSTVKQTLTLNQAERVWKVLPLWTKQFQFVKCVDSASYYSFNFYKRDSLAKNLQTDFKAIKSAVMKNHGEYINSSLDTVKSINRLPVELWISESIIKIDKSNSAGKTKTKFIVVKSLYGC